jgi:hypothetical protein
VIVHHATVPVLLTHLPHGRAARDRTAEGAALAAH